MNDKLLTTVFFRSVSIPAPAYYAHLVAFRFFSSSNFCHFQLSISHSYNVPLLNFAIFVPFLLFHFNFLSNSNLRRSRYHLVEKEHDSGEGSHFGKFFIFVSLYFGEGSHFCIFVSQHLSIIYRFTSFAQIARSFTVWTKI